MMKDSAGPGSTKNLDYLFKPRSIAFVGATEGKVKWGFVIFNNLISGGYEGTIYPVNPGKETVMGIKCYPSVRDVPGEVDLAIFTVPASQVISALDDCAAKGVKAALVITAGFKELGDEGALLEAEMVRKAGAAGITLAGPNGQGVCCPEARFYSWMPIFYPRPGRLSFIAQSGNILNMLIGHVLDSGFGVSKAVSSGNEAQLKTGDYLAYFADDPDTDVVVSYMEGVEDGRRFLASARAATGKKPVVLLKGGRTSSGVLAASSHTGAMAVSDRMFESACRQAGVTLARTIREAGITASSFVRRPLPRGKRVGIVTGGGGLGVIAADACSQYGLQVAPLSGKTLDKVREFLPAYFVPGNPIDLVAGLDLSVIKPVVETVMRSGEVDSVMLIFVESQRQKGPNIKEFGGPGIDIGAFWDGAMKQVRPHVMELNGLAEELGVPLYLVANLQDGKLGGDDEAIQDSPVVYREVESACAAVSAMARYADHLLRTGGRGH